jgi:exopolysaccharide biosynthesis predicted pyruvyltransferase EpsI
LLDVDTFFRPLFSRFVGQFVGLVRPLGNAGDDLIHAATLQMFQRFGIHWRDVSFTDPGSLADVTVLAYAGGGNMGRMWGYHGTRAKLLIQAAAARVPVIVLPQSFHEPCVDNFAHVFVRERLSLKFCPAGELSPDLALGYQLAAEPPAATAGTGVFLRTDRESLPRVRRAGCVDPCSKCADHLSYLALAGQFHEIITDRLHFAVCGLILGRRVTLMANSYHKNRGMWETWLRDLGCKWAV